MVRLGMITVHKCQVLVIAGRWINPSVKAAIIAQSIRLRYGP
jgi:hypothetical protein